MLNMFETGNFKHKLLSFKMRKFAPINNENTWRTYTFNSQALQPNLL
jgi:hypothetical protein